MASNAMHEPCQHPDCLAVGCTRDMHDHLHRKTYCGIHEGCTQFRPRHVSWWTTIKRGYRGEWR